MSDKTYYCTTKGIGWVLLIAIFLLVGVPLLSMVAYLGPEQYSGYCAQAIHMPCFGLGND